MSANRQFATFFLNGSYFGIEALRVQEIIRHQRMTPVPRAPDTIEGLINLRGEIVLAMDLRRRFGMPPRTDGQQATNVVVASDDGTVSLLVDDVGDVVEVRDEMHEPPPETLTGVSRELIRGVFKLKSRLLLALDVDRVINLQALNTTLEKTSKHPLPWKNQPN